MDGQIEDQVRLKDMGKRRHHYNNNIRRNNTINTPRTVMDMTMVTIMGMGRIMMLDIRT
jgi:hypothetical protein